MLAGLCVITITVFAYARIDRTTKSASEKKIFEDRDQSAEIHDFNHVGAHAGAQTGVGAASPSEVTPYALSSHRVEPPLEEIQDPLPRDAHPLRPPEANSPPKPPKPKIPQPECEGVEDGARAATDERDWARVAKLTARKACWASPSERIHLRVNALALMGRVDECVEVGQSSNDPKIVAIVDTCRKMASRTQP